MGVVAAGNLAGSRTQMRGPGDVPGQQQQPTQQVAATQGRPRPAQPPGQQPGQYQPAQASSTDAGARYGRRASPGAGETRPPPAPQPGAPAQAMSASQRLANLNALKQRMAQSPQGVSATQSPGYVPSVMTQQQPTRHIPKPGEVPRTGVAPTQQAARPAQQRSAPPGGPAQQAPPAQNTGARPQSWQQSPAPAQRTAPIPAVTLTRGGRMRSRGSRGAHEA
eukprot:gene14490-20514_t